MVDRETPSHHHHHGNGDKRTAYHSEELKGKMIARLKRIEGQVRGIARMVSEDVYCDDVLHQIAAIESALAGFKTVLMEAHLKSCVIDQLKEGKNEVIDELAVTLRKFLK